MADDVNPTRRAELEAALDVLLPQIRGLHDLANTSISTDLAAAINHQIIVRERRRALIFAELAEMDQANVAHDALLADSYPALNIVPLEQALFKELQVENADLAAAASIFRADQAATLAMTFGEPQPKSKSD